MKKTIMAVDDSASIRQMVSFTLKDAGYEVMEAVDGQDAFTKTRTTTVDLVITDIHMPRMDGISLVKNLRADPNFKFTPILILTTESQPHKKQEGRQAGATGWITKPFSPEQLVAVVRKVLGS